MKWLSLAALMLAVAATTYGAFEDIARCAASAN